jgi:hypothetical protein
LSANNISYKNAKSKDYFFPIIRSKKMNAIVSQMLELRQDWLSSRKQNEREIAGLIDCMWRQLSKKLTPEEKDAYYQEIGKKQNQSLEHSNLHFKKP